MDLVHTPGTQMFIPDVLFRTHLPIAEYQQKEIETVNLAQHLEVAEDYPKYIKRHMEAAVTCVSLQYVVLSEWPDTKGKLSKEVTLFLYSRNELTVGRLAIQKKSQFDPTAVSQRDDRTCSSSPFGC
ncbi:unnamed protein product [Dicrocoelium dendriticum]|nr:unnamed protein product [Dicrocoelium dendriticum]